jgi:hypothetical protein
MNGLFKTERLEDHITSLATSYPTIDIKIEKPTDSQSMTPIFSSYPNQIDNQNSGYSISEANIKNQDQH